MSSTRLAALASPRRRSAAKRAETRPLTLALTLALATSLPVVLAPRAAYGDASDADRATARALANEGHDALERRDYAAAYDCFRRAEAIYHAPTLLLGLARAQVGLGKLVSAGETYQRLASEPPSARANAASAAAIDDGTRELEQLNARIPSVIILIKAPEGAEVTLDGTSVPRAALGVKRPTDPGKHVLVAKSLTAGAAPLTFTLAEAEVKTVLLELTPAAPPPVVGGHGVSSPQRLAGIVALGVGGVGIGLGIVTGVLAYTQRQALAAHCSGTLCPPQERDDVDRFHTVATTSTVGFIAGGVGLAAGAVLIFAGPRAQPAGTSAAAPIAAHLGLGSIQVEGRF